MSKTQKHLDKALVLLGRLADYQDDPCDFDHHGDCQSHSSSGSKPGQCGVAQARAFLAKHRGDGPDTDHDTTKD